MDYCIVNDGNIVINIIVSDSSFAKTIGAFPSYDGAAIGEAYNPPPPTAHHRGTAGGAGGGKRPSRRAGDLHGHDDRHADGGLK